MDIRFKPTQSHYSRSLLAIEAEPYLKHFYQVTNNLESFSNWSYFIARHNIEQSSTALPSKNVSASQASRLNEYILVREVSAYR